jgi:hypothetical protein
MDVHRRQGHLPRAAATSSAAPTSSCRWGITVEGANILTRSLIIFGQGAIRCHPYVLDEMRRARTDRARMEVGWDTIEQRLDEVLRNLPSRPWAGLARFLVLPAGPKHAGPDDALIRRCADFLFEPSETRDRLVSGVHCGRLGGGIGDLEDAFALVVEVTPLRARMKEAGIDDIDTARERGVLGPEEAERLHAAKAAVDRVVAVDDFAAEELSPRAAARETDAATAEPATTDRRSARRKEAVS